MKAYTLDASVAIAWYLPESFSAQARRWQRKLLEQEVRMLIPRLHLWEVANVLRTYVRRHELAAEQAREVYELHRQAPLEEVDPSPAGVLDTALQYDTTAYDAVYIALAQQSDAPLLTAEKTTRPWIVKLGALAVPIA